MVRLREMIIFLIELWINFVLLDVIMICILVKCLLRFVIMVSILFEILIVLEFVWCIMLMFMIGVLFKWIMLVVLVGLKYILVILLMWMLLFIIMLFIFFVDIEVVLVCMIKVCLVDWILLVGILKGVSDSVLVMLFIDRLKLVNCRGFIEMCSICFFFLFNIMLVMLGMFKNNGVILVLICLVSVFMFKVLFEIVRFMIVWVLLLVWMIDICLIFFGSCCWIWLIDLCILLVVFFKLMLGWNLIWIWVEFFLFCV